MKSRFAQRILQAFGLIRKVTGHSSVGPSRAPRSTAAYWGRGTLICRQVPQGRIASLAKSFPAKPGGKTKGTVEVQWVPIVIPIASKHIQWHCRKLEMGWRFQDRSSQWRENLRGQSQIPQTIARAIPESASQRRLWTTIKSLPSPPSQVSTNRSDMSSWAAELPTVVPPILSSKRLRTQNRLLLNFYHSRFGIPGSSALVALEFCKGCASFSFRFSLEVSHVCQTGSETRLAFEDKIFSISETCQAMEWCATKTCNNKNELFDDMEGPDKATGLGNAEIFLGSLGEPQPRKLHHLAIWHLHQSHLSHRFTVYLSNWIRSLKCWPSFSLFWHILYCSSFIYSAG